MDGFDYSQYLDDKRYQRCMAGNDHLGVLLHQAIMRGTRKAIQLQCVPSSLTVAAESAGKVLCHGDRKCGLYSTLSALKLIANELGIFQPTFRSDVLLSHVFAAYSSKS